MVELTIMSMNIKNETAHQYAKELAALTGESVTQAVTEALRQRLEYIRKERSSGRLERLTAIAADCAAHLSEPYRLIDPAEMLYDEQGLPK